MTAVQYFAYGSNMLTERLQQRCSSATYVGLASVPDYRFTFSKRSIDRSGKGNISSVPDAKVFGVLFNLEELQLPELDRLEGVGNGYDRIDNLSVQLEDSDELVQVITYVADARYVVQSLRPYHWYLDLVLAGARQHKLPDQYVHQIEITESIDDPWPNRPQRLEALELLERLPPGFLKRR